MVMILLNTNELYYNTQVYFAKHFMDGLTNDANALRQSYHAWLKTQGAVVIKGPESLICNILGIAPSYDKFGFKNEHDAIVFVLRWS